MLAHRCRHVYRVPEVARAPTAFRHHFHKSGELRVGNIQRLFWVRTADVFPLRADTFELNHTFDDGICFIYRENYLSPHLETRNFV